MPRFIGGSKEEKSHYLVPEIEKEEEKKNGY